MNDPDVVYVDYRKWRSIPHWQVYVFALGEDDYGRWFFMPKDTPNQRGNELPVTQGPHAMLLPWRGLFTAGFNTRGPGVEVYVDIVAQPRFGEGRLALVDVDLDIIRYWDGRCIVDDRDEFELHTRTLSYPRELVQETEQAAQEVFNLVSKRVEPFGDVGSRWLAKGLERGWSSAGLPKLPLYEDRLQMR